MRKGRVERVCVALYRGLVRIGRRPPKPVVVGSNPTPPAYNKPRTVTGFL
jgi:hypothetical protein